MDFINIRRGEIHIPGIISVREDSKFIYFELALNLSRDKESGSYVAFYDFLPNAIAEADTAEEAETNLKRIFDAMVTDHNAEITAKCKKFFASLKAHEHSIA